MQNPREASWILRLFHEFLACCEMHKCTMSLGCCSWSCDAVLVLESDYAIGWLTNAKARVAGYCELNTHFLTSRDLTRLAGEPC
jgi:hypothetical protein